MPEKNQIESLVERILSEGPLGMSAIAKIYGSFRDGCPTHPSTPTRHHLRGVTLPDGTIIRLEAVRISGRLMSSRAAVARFISQQQQEFPPSVPPTPVHSPASRNRTAEAASKELDNLGLR